MQYTIGDTIAGFPSGFLAAIGNFSRASVSITGDGTTITVEINHDGSAAYTGATYTCTSAGGCTIVNGRVTKGTVNATTMTVTVGAAPTPDLVVDTPTVSTSSPIAGTSFTLSATVRNQGSERSAFTRLRYYRSTDATITSGDMSEGTDCVRRCCAATLRINAYQCHDVLMRTTVELPDDLHALARELAHQQNKTLSGVIVEMLRKAIGTGDATRDTPHETGWPTVSLDRPITIEDVRSLEDEG